MSSIRTMTFLRGRETPAAAAFAPGDRVAMHPAMRTLRHAHGRSRGTVEKTARSRVLILWDGADRATWIHPSQIIGV
jgi:hypothetical protein